jgi:signal transduction histidine kinase
MSEPNTDLALPEDLLNPFTGELVPTGDLARVAATLDDLRGIRQKLNDAVAAFTEAVIAESRRQGTRTLQAAGVRLEVSADNTIEWDVEELLKLRDLGLPEARYNELVQQTVTFKVNGSVARQLEGASEEYAKVIDRARVRVPRKQYVSVR